MRNHLVSVAISSSTVVMTAILITGCPSQSGGRVGESGGGAVVDAQLFQLETEIDAFTQQLQAAKNQDQIIGTNASSGTATGNCMIVIPSMRQRLQAIASSASGNSKFERVSTKLENLRVLSECSS